MTILQVASGSSGYGGERILLSISKYLRKKGHCVIIASPGEGEFVNMCRQLGFKVVVIPMKKTYDFIAAFRLFLLIKRECVDIVHSHGLLVNIITRAAVLFSGYSLIHTIHVIQHLREPSVPFKRKLRNIYYRLLDNFTARLCQKIITVSDAVKRDLVKQGLRKEKIITIHNGIEEVDKPAGRDRAYLRPFGIDEKDKLVGLVGRIVPKKGHDDFITCAKMLADIVPEAKFLIVGEDIICGGRYSDMLKQRVKMEGLEGRVIFTGFIKSINEVIASLNVLTLPAWEEPFGLVILEAMALGVPVVATNSGGIPEIITDGENGLLVPAHSPDELSKAILKILISADFAARLAGKGLESVKYYTAERMAEAVERVYKSII